MNLRNLATRHNAAVSLLVIGGSLIEVALYLMLGQPALLLFLGISAVWVGFALGED